MSALPSWPRIRDRIGIWRQERRYAQAKRRHPITDFESAADATDEAVDVIVPVTAKDLAVLPLAVQGIRANVRHRIDSIHVVASPDDRVIAFCREAGCRFVDENDLAVAKPRIVYRPRGIDRAGWIFQQLVKLSGEIGTRPWILACDADTVLVRPHVFISGGKHVLYTARYHHHAPYRRTYRALLGYRMTRPLSFVSHFMALNRARLFELHHEIQARHGAAWTKAILACMDADEISAFSEYETYGNWIARREPAFEVPNFNADAADPPPACYDSVASRYGPTFKSVSFHAYMQA